MNAYRSLTRRAGIALALGVFLGLAGGILLSVAPAAADVELHGFVESGFGIRTADVGAPPRGLQFPPGYAPAVWARTPDFTLRESRLQLRGNAYSDVGEAIFRVDLTNDQVRGQGVDLELREANLKFTTLADHLEVRAGRQPTTWGTGDLLFINDLFPKDWRSFFSGREDQYLKAPSDALRLGVYGLPSGLDIVYTPQFTPDRLPDGTRFVFTVPAPLPVDQPAGELSDGEVAVRLNRYMGSWNLAGYGYLGYWKSPTGARVVVDRTDPSAPQTTPAGFTYPRLNVYGASARGPLGGGVAWLEGGYYHSVDAGELIQSRAQYSAVLAPASEVRAMVGYERQWFTDFTGGLQFYTEYMRDRDETKADYFAVFDPAAFPAGYVKDELRTLLALRLDKFMLYQTLRLSSFTYYSPSDEDVYLRLLASYNLSDEVTVAAGANLFDGSDRRTMFAMGDQNDNVFVRLRYGF